MCVGRLALFWVLASAIGVSGTAHADDGAPRRAPAVQPAAPAPPPMLVLRPVPRLARVARRVARVLLRRAVAGVRIGEPPPPVAEAVTPGQLAMVRTDEGVSLVLGGLGGASFSTEVELRRPSGEPAVRAIALAVESLEDTAQEAAARGTPAIPGGEERVDRIVPTLRGSLFAPRRPIAPIAKPTMYLRMLLGFSPVRGTPLIGPGVGLGLCVTSHCVVIVADLPLLAERRQAPHGEWVRYRSVDAGVVAQLRPFHFGPFTPGLTFGLVSRIGNAALEATGRDDRFVTNLAVRSTLEIAWRFAPRFELALEGGVDLAVSRASYIRYHDSVFLEDRWTPWIVTSIRLRP